MSLGVRVDLSFFDKHASTFVSVQHLDLNLEKQAMKVFSVINWG